LLRVLLFRLGGGDFPLLARKSEGVRTMEHYRLMQRTGCYKRVYRHTAFRIRGKLATAANFLGFPLVFLSILLMLTGCATTLPKDVQRTPSTAFANYNTTSIGQFFEEAALQHPGKSGFTLIQKGRRAFTSRIAMTAFAEKTMDLQYYIWEPDTTGWILALRLVEAADRTTTPLRAGTRASPPWMRIRTSRSASSTRSPTAVGVSLGS
jgi:hypothetical protein